MIFNNTILFLTVAFFHPKIETGDCSVTWKMENIMKDNQKWLVENRKQENYGESKRSTRKWVERAGF